MNIRSHIINTLLITTILLTFNTAFAAVHHVPGDHPTIQTAMDVAFTGDTVLVADGTYSGPGNQNLDFSGKELLITSENGAAACIIDCGFSERAFYFESHETMASVVRGFTVRAGWNLYGGAVYCQNNSSPTFHQCIFSDNTGRWGGVFYGNSQSAPVINDCRFEGNSALSHGAAYYGDNSSPVFNNCLFVDNATDDAGGACYFKSSSPARESIPGKDASIAHQSRDTAPQFHNCTFAYNDTVGFGGAVFFWDASPEIENTILWGNTPDQIFHIGSGTVQVSHCDVQDGYPGTENLDADPVFVTGVSGKYYLSQIASGQPLDSPCVDTGNESVTDVCYTVFGTTICMDQMTTRNDHIEDTSSVNMGYHYDPSVPPEPTPTPTTTPPTPLPTATPTAEPPPTSPPTPTCVPGIPEMSLTIISIDDSVGECSDFDGILDAGEEADVEIRFTSVNSPGENVCTSIASENPHVAIDPGGAYFGTIDICDVFYETFRFTMSGDVECNEELMLSYITAGYYCGQEWMTPPSYLYEDMEIDITETGWECDDTPCGLVCIHNGDVDDNGSLTPEDALNSFQIYLLMFPYPTYEEFCRADCNGSGGVTPRDALCIFQNYLQGSCACMDDLR